MKKYLLGSLIVGFIYLLFNTSTLACKMTTIGASTQVLKAILDKVSQDENQQQRSIKTIRKDDNANWNYIIETTQDGQPCEVIVLQAIIHPNCKIEIHPLKKNINCENPDLK